MLPVRRSEADVANEALVEEQPGPETSNAEWIASLAASGLGAPGDVLLVGGATLADFRVRVAQSQARREMTPSTWSFVGLLTPAGTVSSVPLAPIADASIVPSVNAIQEMAVDTFADPETYPNVAVVRFPADPDLVLAAVERLRAQRTIADLPRHLLEWLGFVWGAGSGTNPLLASIGVPSAVFVETAFAMTNVELTPGLASAASCPEAIWQAAKWWHGFYASVPPAPGQSDADRVPAGRYVVRQPRASYLDPA